MLMRRRRAIPRFRDRLVLGHLRPLLDEGEEVAVWVHVQTPEGSRHGIVSLTSARCLVNWTPRDLPDVAIRWDEVTAWRLQDVGQGRPVLTVEAREADVAVRLPVSTKARARRGSRLLRAVAELAPNGAARPEIVSGDDLELQPERRGLRGHTRRVVVTVLGVLVIVVGIVFASPFVPGPGALTILAGLAILATEYDWARDIHHWLRRKLEQVWERIRAHRANRRARRRGSQLTPPGAVPRPASRAPRRSVPRRRG